ncbi:hypothetical protein [Mycobacterium pseudokansasii]|nr:hypothetical protein [Mycobacterium pseudokansasii]
MSVVTIQSGCEARLFHDRFVTILATSADLYAAIEATYMVATS